MCQKRICRYQTVWFALWGYLSIVSNPLSGVAAVGTRETASAPAAALVVKEGRKSPALVLLLHRHLHQVKCHQKRKAPRKFPCWNPSLLSISPYRGATRAPALTASAAAPASPAGASVVAAAAVTPTWPPRRCYRGCLGRCSRRYHRCPRPSPLSLFLPPSQRGATRWPSAGAACATASIIAAVSAALSASLFAPLLPLLPPPPPPSPLSWSSLSWSGAPCGASSVGPRRVPVPSPPWPYF